MKKYGDIIFFPVRTFFWFQYAKRECVPQKYPVAFPVTFAGTHSHLSSFVFSLIQVWQSYALPVYLLLVNFRQE